MTARLINRLTLTIGGYLTAAAVLILTVAQSAQGADEPVVSVAVTACQHLA